MSNLLIDHATAFGSGTDNFPTTEEDPDSFFPSTFSLGIPQPTREETPNSGPNDDTANPPSPLRINDEDTSFQNIGSLKPDKQDPSGVVGEAGVAPPIIGDGSSDLDKKLISQPGPMMAKQVEHARGIVVKSDQEVPSPAFALVRPGIPPARSQPTMGHVVIPGNQPLQQQHVRVTQKNTSVSGHKRRHYGRNDRKSTSAPPGEREKGRNPWTAEEDECILKLVRIHGLDKGWKFLCAGMQGRTAKQCSERWRNHLDPAVRKHTWTEEEDTVLIQTHQMMGAKWSTMAKMLPGRTDHAIKNRWYSTMRRVNRQFRSHKISNKDMRQPLFRYCFSCIQNGNMSSQVRSIQPLPKRRKTDPKNKTSKSPPPPSSIRDGVLNQDYQPGSYLAARGYPQGGYGAPSRIMIPRNHPNYYAGPQSAPTGKYWPQPSPDLASIGSPASTATMGSPLSPGLDHSSMTTFENERKRLTSFPPLPSSSPGDVKLGGSGTPPPVKLNPLGKCRVCGSSVVDNKPPALPLNMSGGMGAIEAFKRLEGQAFAYDPYPMLFKICKNDDPALGKIAQLYFTIHIGNIPLKICQLATKGEADENVDFTGYQTLTLYTKNTDGSGGETLVSACTFKILEKKEERKAAIEVLLFASDPSKHYGYGRLLLASLGYLACKEGVELLLTSAAQQAAGYWSQIGYTVGMKGAEWSAVVKKLTGELIVEKAVPLNVNKHFRSIVQNLLMLPPSVRVENPSAIQTVPNILAWVEEVKDQLTKGSLCKACEPNGATPAVIPVLSQPNLNPPNTQLLPI
mmetsp:Transcript_8441/g.16360  ORF Transcript_8441/g.16360 Transcript_8441/m.16360 type:complete len:793 (+) Transcript_8441:198-2576(+)|eukprot:CAMPEP_0167773822 /NCGR_PEP_ID=MMETSP0111_2-20121227/1650_1 /TAXON_ID=91324 /ORGANISM="Lotharella globosa, Strain CCCM811" /LENGTH=792 /DNA_ID=CAMNT_0007663535 /DNA_START=140 /DNA_END=2518 /DNA_ORIENTATION=-